MAHGGPGPSFLPKVLQAVEETIHAYFIATSGRIDMMFVDPYLPKRPTSIAGYLRGFRI